MVRSASVPRPIANLPIARQATQNARSTTPMMMPAIVRLRMCQIFGLGDGRTLSVDEVIERKSPVIIIKTISIGVRMAWPVMIRPAPKNRT